MGYGFVKFVSHQDAQAAAKQCNDAFLDVNNTKYKLKVTLASVQTQNQPDSKLLETIWEGKKRDKRVLDKKSIPDVTSNKISEYSPVDGDEDQLKTKQSQSQSRTTTFHRDMEDDPALTIMAKRKRTSRVIVRNVSFYADEKHIQSALEQEFGPIVELTLPRVNETLHRGFCFATFESAEHAAKAATGIRTKPFTIKKRAVTIDFALSKAVHQKVKDVKEDLDNEGEEEEDDVNNNEVDDDENEEEQADQPDIEDDDDDSESQDEDDVVDGDEVAKTQTKKPRREPPEVDEGVLQRKTVFIRNLPFDTTRNDIFQLLLKFGHIESIFPVMDKETGVFKGTAFCSFRNSDAANRALEAAASSGDFQSQRDLQVEGNGLHLRGRRVFIDLAVDKQTASTLTMDKKDGAKITGKDRRCLYLSSEGFVPSQPADSVKPDPHAWESLPESDQLKRQRALTEKTTKLKSPLFFINPTRLSIRNLSKHVDESALKELCVKALRRGLDNNLVKADDQVAYWRAADGLSAREVMNKIRETKETNKESIIPTFNEQNIKQYIPSVFIDRDYSANKKEKGISRGFGFVDFTHHAHALACLREMNNNPVYSADFVPNGKKAMQVTRSTKRKQKGTMPDDGLAGEGDRSRIPRLIVEFTVENKAKALQQAANRAKQQANIETQKIVHVEKKERTTEKKTKHRGAIQREKKRKQRDEGIQLENTSDDANNHDEPEQIQPRDDKVKEKKPVKRPKKQKIDKEDQTFETLVRNYTDAFNRTESKSNEHIGQVKSQVKEKRWFE